MYTISKDILKKLKEIEKEKEPMKISHSNIYILYKETYKRCQKEYYIRKRKIVKCKNCNKEYTEIYYKSKHEKVCQGEIL